MFRFANAQKQTYIHICIYTNMPHIFENQKISLVVSKYRNIQKKIFIKLFRTEKCLVEYMHYKTQDFMHQPLMCEFILF